jgi:hypothetical protein
MGPFYHPAPHSSTSFGPPVRWRWDGSRGGTTARPERTCGTIGGCRGGRTCPPYRRTSGRVEERNRVGASWSKCTPVLHSVTPPTQMRGQSRPPPVPTDGDALGSGPNVTEAVQEEAYNIETGRPSGRSGEAPGALQWGPGHADGYGHSAGVGSLRSQKTNTMRPLSPGGLSAWRRHTGVTSRVGGGRPPGSASVPLGARAPPGGRAGHGIPGGPQDGKLPTWQVRLGCVAYVFRVPLGSPTGD